LILDQYRELGYKPPILGDDSMLRSDQIRRWPDLRVAERERLTSRVVVVGAERSGKTTLVDALVAHYRAIGGVFADTRGVAEYRQQYAADHDPKWTADDFARIAQRQQEDENTAASLGSPVLFCDTDVLSVAVWERRFLGESTSAQALPTPPDRALYLLADHTDVAFSSPADGDGLREQMTAWLIEELTRGGYRWQLLSGAAAYRLEQGIRLADGVLGR
jgi:nicotinamide riboside kinase